MLYFDPIDMMVTFSIPKVSLSFQKTPLNKNFDPFLVLVASEKSLLGSKHVIGKASLYEVTIDVGEPEWLGG